jgi:Protein of unknown function (DUF2934)
LFAYGANKTFLRKNVTETPYNGVQLFMPKKQPITKATATSAAPARSATPRTTRVTSVKHSKPQGVEAPVEEIAAPVAAVPAIAPIPAVAAVQASDAVQASEAPREAIAKIAYGYWEARGRTGESADEDWVRAEAEYLSLSRE